MKEDHEKAIGAAWYEGKYDQHQAELVAELQGLSWENVLNEYAYQYEKYERAGAMSWN